MWRPDALGAQPLESRGGKLLTVAAVIAATGALTAFAGTANAVAAEPECQVRSMPSLVESATTSSVADIVEVSCEDSQAGNTVEVSSLELYEHCRNSMKWSAPYPYKPVKGAHYKVTLDDVGNATAVLWAGPSCAAGEVLITAHLLASSTTRVTSFTVLPPETMAPGLYVLPAGQVEDSLHSGVATLLQVAYAPGYADQPITITAPAMPRRCGQVPHVVWVGAEAKTLSKGKESITNLQLDNDGNVFVVLLGGPSCVPGESLIAATLESSPFYTYTAAFTILPPQPRI